MNANCDGGRLLELASVVASAMRGYNLNSGAKSKHYNNH